MESQATGALQISEILTQLSEAAHQTAESLRQSNVAIEQLNGAIRPDRKSSASHDSNWRGTDAVCRTMSLPVSSGRKTREYVLEAGRVVKVLPLVDLKKIPEAPRGLPEF